MLYDNFKWSFERLAIALSCDASCLKIIEQGCGYLCQFRISSDFNTSIWSFVDDSETQCVLTYTCVATDETRATFVSMSYATYCMKVPPVCLISQIMQCIVGITVSPLSPPRSMLPNRCHK